MVKLLGLVREWASPPLSQVRSDFKAIAADLTTLVEELLANTKSYNIGSATAAAGGGLDGGATGGSSSTSTTATVTATATATTATTTITTTTVMEAAVAVTMVGNSEWHVCRMTCRLTPTPLAQPMEAPRRLLHEHVLLPSVKPYVNYAMFENAWFCNVCGVQRRNAISYHCDQCYFDCCESCYEGHRDELLVVQDDAAVQWLHSNAAAVPAASVPVSSGVGGALAGSGSGSGGWGGGGTGGGWTGGSAHMARMESAYAFLDARGSVVSSVSSGGWVGSPPVARGSSSSSSSEWSGVG